MRLYHHKTDGGAQYLMDTFIQCKNDHREGVIEDHTRFIVRIDGDITKDAEINVRHDSELVAALEGLMQQAAKDAEVYAPEGNEPIWAYIDDASDALFKARN